MATLVNRAIRTAAAWAADQAAMEALYGAGGYYTTLSAAIAAIPADMVAADEKWIIDGYDDWPSGLDDSVPKITKATNASCYIVIQAATGHEYHHHLSKGFHLYTSDTYDAALEYKTASYSKVLNIGVINLASNGCGIRTLSSHTEVSGCYGEGGSAGGLNSSGYGALIRDSIGVARSITSSAGIDLGGYGDAVVNNCVGIGGLYGLDYNPSNPTPYTNCIGFGAGTADVHASILGSHNASGDGSGPVGTIAVTEGDFVDYDAGDYRTKSTSSLATAGDDGTFIGALLEAGGSDPAIVAIPAVISATPIDAQIDRVNSITATSAAIMVAPQNALVDRINQITASAAAISVTPNDAIVERVNSITATPATIDVAATDALVERVNSITAIPAAISIVATNAVISQDPVIVATPASISVVPTNAVIDRVNTIAANPAEIAVAPQNAIVERVNRITATPATISVTATDALVDRVNQITAIPAQIHLVPTNAIITLGDAIVGIPASISVTPVDAVIERVNAITAIPASISVTATDALIGEQINLDTALIIDTGIHFGTPAPLIGRWRAQQPIAKLTFR